MKLALEELARKAVRVDGITDDEVDIEFYHAEGGHKEGTVYINLAYQDGTKEKMMEVLGDELSHYVDYRKGRSYDDRRQDISRGYGDDAGSQTMGYIGGEEGDYLGFQEELGSLDFSEINREVAAAEGLEERRYKVEVDVFIPYEKVEHPGNWIPIIKDRYFHGDNRGPFEEGSSRMKQTFIVETDPNKSEDPLLQQNDHQATTVLSDNEGNILKSKEASSEYTSVVTRTGENNGDNVQIDVSGQGKNPLLDYIFVPAINYEYEINIHPNQDGLSTIRVEGMHDGFPAYSVQITDMENGFIYRPRPYMPESPQDVNELFPIPGSAIEFKYENKEN